MMPEERDTNMRVGDDAEGVARAVARRFAEMARACVSERGSFSVALAGGTTPKRVYELLADEELRGEIPWEGVHVFFGDERCVPPDHADSNYRMAHEALLSRVPVPEKNIHRMRGEGDSAAGARLYEDELRAFFSDAEWPRFDLVMLGMGDDGHTASLFPGTTALEEQRAWVVANWVEKFETWRVTLTAPAINHARHVFFVVTGAGKAARLAEILKGERDPSRLPSQLIEPEDGMLEWFIDRDAAADL